MDRDGVGRLERAVGAECGRAVGAGEGCRRCGSVGGSFAPAIATPSVCGTAASVRGATLHVVLGKIVGAERSFGDAAVEGRAAWGRLFGSCFQPPRPRRGPTFGRLTPLYRSSCYKQSIEG